MTKNLLFSVTESDCEFTYTKGSGAGGQKRNKTSNAVYCKHKDSGGQGYSEDTRSQHENKRIAFKRMAESEKFRAWHKQEISKRIGTESAIQDKVESQMSNKYIRTEIKNEHGLWVESNDLTE